MHRTKTSLSERGKTIVQQSFKKILLVRRLSLAPNAMIYSEAAEWKTSSKDHRVRETVGREKEVGIVFFFEVASYV